MVQAMMDLHCDTLTREGFPGGEREVGRPFFDQSRYQLAISRLPAGASTGMHRQKHSRKHRDIPFGQGMAARSGAWEPLLSRRCLKGFSCGIANTGEGELPFAAVPEL